MQQNIFIGAFSNFGSFTLLFDLQWPQMFSEVTLTKTIKYLSMIWFTMQKKHPSKLKLRNDVYMCIFLFRGLRLLLDFTNYHHIFKSNYFVLIFIFAMLWCNCIYIKHNMLLIFIILTFHYFEFSRKKQVLYIMTFLRKFETWNLINVINLFIRCIFIILQH